MGLPGADAAPPGLLAGVLALAVFHALIEALAPPTAWDSLAYHLALPKLYLRAGAVRELPWLMHSHWPHLMESLYALPLAFGFEEAAALLHAALCAALVLATALAARRLGGPLAAWVAAALLCAQPALLRIAGTAHSDGALALFHLLSCLALADWEERGDGGRLAPAKRLAPAGRLALAGLLAGCAAAAKLHGAGLAAIWCAWLLWRSGPAAAALYLGCALAVAGPWYLKTWAGAGNPVWPFFFGGEHGAELVLASMARGNTLDWETLPAMVRYFGPHYLLVPLAGLALLGRGARPKDGRPGLPPLLRLLLVPALPYGAMVLWRTEAWRFYLPCLPGLAAAAGYFAARIWAAASPAGDRRRWAAAALVAFGVWPALAVGENNPLYGALGLRPRSAPERDRRELYLERSLDHYAGLRAAELALASDPEAGDRAISRGSAASEAVGAAPGFSRVLLWRETRGYYLDSDYLWGDPGNQGLLAYAGMRDAGELAGRLGGLGVTHVLVHEASRLYRPGEGDYPSRVAALMDELLARRARLVGREAGVALYALNAP